MTTPSVLVLRAADSMGLTIAGIVLNRMTDESDASVESNAAELARWTRVPILADLAYRATGFSTHINWPALAAAR